MVQIGIKDYPSLAKTFAVSGFIVLMLMVYAMNRGEFHIMDLGTPISCALVAVFTVAAFVIAGLYYKGIRAAGIIAVVVGAVSVVFGTCLMLGVIENFTGYAGWGLLLYGILCFYGAYNGKQIAAAEN